jgi:predicted TPR repeat methyltransferase
MHLNERERAGRKASTFFDDLWQHGDPWELETSDFEQARYAHKLSMVQSRRYERVLEIGCGAGQFTRLIAPLAEQIVALDVSTAAIDRARKTGLDRNIDYRAVNVMEYDVGAEGPWDLIILSETIYYLGWLYSFFDVAWLAAQLYQASTLSGRLLLANTAAELDDYLVRPWVIRTYRDLFLNVGYELESESVFGGTKNNVELEVLVSLFQKIP